MSGLLKPLLKTARTATRIVAASDADDKSKAGADYVCQGAGDQETIMAALAECNMGKVQLLGGTYWLSAPITYSLNQVASLLQGSGTQSCVLKAQNGTNLAALINADVSVYNAVLRDFRVEGNKDNNPTSLDGIDCANFSGGCALENIWVQNVKRDGFHYISFRGASLRASQCDRDGFTCNEGARLIHCEAGDNGNAGFAVDSSYGSSWDIWFIGCNNDGSANTPYGFYVGGGHRIIIIGCVVNTADVGYALEGASKGCILIGNSAYSALHQGFRLYNAYYASLIGNAVQNCGQATADHSDSGITLDTCDNTVVKGNIVWSEDSKMLTGIYDTDSAQLSIIEGNQLVGTYKDVALKRNGVKSVYRNNYPFNQDSFKAVGQSVAIGASDAYGAATEVKSPSGVILKLGVVKLTIGGTFAAEETVTVKIETVWKSDSVASVEKAFTATGTSFLAMEEQDGLDLWKDSDTCYLIKLYAKTNQASTAVTVTGDLVGAG